MNRLAVLTGFQGLFVLAFALAGCNSVPSDANPTPPGGESSDDRGEHADHANHDHDSHSHAGGTDMEKMKAELAKLSPEDAASAEKQHVCPVSGEMLGTMGPPLKIDVNGQQVWICCDGCRDKLLASPAEYLAKLKKQ